MKPYYQDEWVTIYNGDNRLVLPGLPSNSIDAIVCDPPYGLRFMGKKWDYDVPSVEVWRECLRILKPGGHLLSFGGTRTYHRMVVAIEDAGFEIRDMISWVYGSGFPKSLDVSKAIDQKLGAKRESVGTKKQTGAKFKLTQELIDNGGFNDPSRTEFQVTAPASPEAAEWSGYGTALKPSLEPIVMARKPIQGTVAENVLRWGVGGLNIDGCRVEIKDELPKYQKHGTGKVGSGGVYQGGYKGKPTIIENVHSKSVRHNASGRFPANLIHDGSDEVISLFPQSEGQQGIVKGTEPSRTGDTGIYGTYGRVPQPMRGDTGSAARFFYTAKASRSERGKDNNHPTVKPLDLMRYLVRLVCPIGGTVLDCYAGSGTTLEAAKANHCKSIGIEQEIEYCRLIEKRIVQGAFNFEATA